MSKAIKITDNVLRDGHQSLFATRMRIDDMLPIAEKLDQIGFWSLETWGGATFDACIRFLGEDPWERLRQLKAAMPNTPQQMLLRGQNGLGYRHYADDVIEKFVERCAANGMDVFRIFDAMNDMRNLETAVKATIANERHAQGTISYTLSPVHTLDKWLDMAKKIEDMGCHSLCIKDMAGLLKPYAAYELITEIKKTVDLPIAVHSHATTGLSTATLFKSVEAGCDVIDTSISSMSMTYGHSPTESLVAMFQDTEYDSGLNIEDLEEIAAYFREVRKKYAQFEGALKGIDSRILVAQVPGGMLTNLEGQLKEQGAADRLDEVLEEIPRVREDLGFIPLVTPTSQIVGTQAVINVLSGERYKTITKETAGVLKGEYGATAAPVNEALQKRVLEEGGEVITCRPADKIDAEMDKLTEEFLQLAQDEHIEVADHQIDDVLIYAQFPQVGLHFLKNRHNPDAFEPEPGTEAEPVATAAATTPSTGPEQFQVTVNGKQYEVIVSAGGEITQISEGTSSTPAPAAAATHAEHEVYAPMAGSVLDILVNPGDAVEDNQLVMIIEAMKMETEIRANQGGTVKSIHIKKGDAIQVNQPLITLT